MSSRTKRKERNLNREQQPQPKNQEKKGTFLSRWLEVLSPTGKLAAAVALFLTIVGSYYAFSPKLSITASEIIDPSNPYSTPFTVRNDSLLPVKSIKLKYSPRKMLSENGGSITFSGPTIEEAVRITRTLDAGESTTFFLPSVVGFKGGSGMLKHLDVDVFISYRPSLLPYLRSKHFRFSTIKTSDGKFHWISRAVDE